ncbi:MAG: ATP-binding protein [Candidatus Binatia bacterium]
MRPKFWPALSLRGKVIAAIIVLQAAMIAIFVSVQTYHEFLMVREYIKGTNVQFVRNLAHSFFPLVHLHNLRLLKQCVNLVIGEEDVRYVVVHGSDGRLVAARFKDSAASLLTDWRQAEKPSVQLVIREVESESGWLSPFFPITYEISIPIPPGTDRGIGWITLAVDTRRMDLKVWAGALRGLLMAGLALGVVGLFAFIVDRRLKGIFRGLAGVTRRMAAGDLNQRVNINTGDELQELGDSFNRMADNLASSQQLLQEWARDLEVKVRERTQDLEEEKLKLDMIVSGIGAGLVLLNRELRVLWGNRIATEWFGPLDQLEGRKCFEVLWGGTNACAECATIKAIQSGNVEHGEKAVPGSNGQPRFFQITTSPIKNSQGDIIQVLELIQDITDKKQLETQLLQAGKMMAMGELASGIAHEINNPLAVIGANAERMGYLSSYRHLPVEKRYEKFPSYLENILRHTYRCKEIIQKLLNFARHKEADWQPTDINMVLEESIALVRHQASIENKRIIKNLCPELSLIQSDFNGLEQVFVNLLTNAMDAIDGTGKIHVSSWEEAGLVKVEIADTGRGIASEHIDRIFQPFFTTKPPGKGTGLGLSICARILSRLGGQVKVQTTPGGGTRICVSLLIGANHIIEKIQESDYGKTSQHPVSG